MRIKTRSIQACAQASLVVVLLILASCSYEGLPELTLKHVSLADWKGYRGGDKRLVLLVELMETGRPEDYPDAPYVWSGFCGEGLTIARLALGLYSQRQSGENLMHYRNKTAPEADIRAPVFAVVDVARPQGLAGDPHFPDFDLRHDERDICLRTSVMVGMFTARQSNTVRVPHDAIARALREGVKPLPPLMPLAETVAGPSITK